MAPDSALRLSVLDLSPVASGSSPAQALHHTLDLARLADQLGYYRYWLAEHHNTALLASGAPEVLIGHVAGVTQTLRVGSGGIMLPNHAPLKVAETFRMLEALHPGRIDLGLGRAPGTDGRTALALRRSREALWSDDFPQQLGELLSLLEAGSNETIPHGGVRAIPLGVPSPDVWLLGSSDFSARLAAALGLGFAFAHHINPQPAVEVLRLYQDQFRPSDTLDSPRAFITISAVCAPTDEEAQLLATSARLTLLRFGQGVSAPLPSVEEATTYPYTDYEREHIEANSSRLLVGSPSNLRDQMHELAVEAGVGEIMITSLIHDHEARRRSYALLAEAFAGVPVS